MDNGSADKVGDPGHFSLTDLNPPPPVFAFVLLFFESFCFTMFLVIQSFALYSF